LLKKIEDVYLTENPDYHAVSAGSMVTAGIPSYAKLFK